MRLDPAGVGQILLWIRSNRLTEESRLQNLVNALRWGTVVPALYWRLSATQRSMLIGFPKWWQTPWRNRVSLLPENFWCNTTQFLSRIVKQIGINPQKKSWQLYFFNKKKVILLEFILNGTTVTSDSYVSIWSKHRPTILRATFEDEWSTFVTWQCKASRQFKRQTNNRNTWLVHTTLTWPPSAIHRIAPTKEVVRKQQWRWGKHLALGRESKKEAPTKWIFITLWPYDLIQSWKTMIKKEVDYMKD